MKDGGHVSENQKETPPVSTIWLKSQRRMMNNGSDEDGHEEEYWSEYEFEYENEFEDESEYE
jgi:hypothetical protein